MNKVVKDSLYGAIIAYATTIIVLMPHIKFASLTVPLASFIFALMGLFLGSATLELSVLLPLSIIILSLLDACYFEQKFRFYKIRFAGYIIGFVISGLYVLESVQNAA